MTAAGSTEAPVHLAVRLPPVPDDVGEWLTDASAFDAAGAAALWVDGADEESEDTDVLTLTAALAVVTFRARLVMPLPEPAPPALARALTTITRLSRGRLVLVGDTAPVPDAGLMRPTPGDPGGFTEPRPSGEVLRWAAAVAPQGRDSWRELRDDAAARGVDGLVVPADPLLLDILRNPDDPGDRRDLHLAQG